MLTTFLPVNIFVGIKTPGAFQHSSFLGGGLATSAGLISVKNGAIRKLSPLSGHYRTSIQHFRCFLSALEERGVDMRRVEISKAEAALWGLEHLARFKKKQASTFSRSNESTSLWKREVLEGRKRNPNAHQGGQQSSSKDETREQDGLSADDSGADIQGVQRSAGPQEQQSPEHEP